MFYNQGKIGVSMKISILTQPHTLQRYNTVGDWFTDRNTGQVRILVSELGSWRYELLVAVHELIEAFLCMHDEVAEESVTQFDKLFVVRDSEPGDSPNAPYQKQHCLATGIERILAACLGVKWIYYEDAIEKLIIERERTEQNAGKQSLGDA
jgi:hypothetical protein